MRVRPQPFRRSSTQPRRPHVIGRPAEAPAPAAAPAPEPRSAEADAAGELAAERRMRQAGGPDDRALYSCTCGYVFAAEVSTSVACPQCGTGQAW